MRPERCARERTTAAVSSLSSVSASMRPERCARERFHLVFVIHRKAPRTASMRPERCARERVDHGVRTQVKPTGFNEARAVCSGKAHRGASRN